VRDRPGSPRRNCARCSPRPAPARSDRLHRFFTWCAAHDHIPELVTLAETVSRWREHIAAAIILKVSNAKSEGTNRVIKLVARIAFGFRDLRDPVNQRRRSRYASTRITRRPPRRVTKRRSRSAIKREHTPLQREDPVIGDEQGECAGQGPRLLHLSSRARFATVSR
jgi:hypothetical protein